MRRTRLLVPAQATLGGVAVPLLAALGGIAFALFPLLRPWGDKTGSLPAMARAFADPLWVLSHLSGMIGWVLLAAAAATFAVWSRSRSAAAGAWTTGVGVVLVLPFFGAETFGLHALGRFAAGTGNPALVEAEAVIRGDAIAMAMFGVGLLTAAAGSALLALATWREPRQRGYRWVGVPLAVLIGLYLPQFFAPDVGRIVHGLLLAVACILWGALGSPGQVSDAGELPAADPPSAAAPSAPGG